VLPVDDHSLRQFATARFVEGMLNRDAVRASRGAALSKEVSLIQWIGAAEDLVETRAWLALGVQIGYFNYVPSLSDETEGLSLVERAGSSPVARWPLWFRQFAAGLQGSNLFPQVEQNLPFNEPSTLGIFQASLILAGDFREPLLVNLQRGLRWPKSQLDGKHVDVTAADVFAAIHASPDYPPLSQPLVQSETVVVMDPTSSMARYIAGFIQLIDLLAAFDHLFPELEKRDSPAVYIQPEDFSRNMLAKATGNILRWRLNLWDEQVVRRLRVLSEVFWDVCEREFHRYPDLSFQWSAPQSRRELIEMLRRWRDRGEPEPGGAQLDFSEFDAPGSGSFSHPTILETDFETT
jgi:hypothetical protein